MVLNLKQIFQMFVNMWTQCVDKLNTIQIGDGTIVEVGLFNFFITLIVFSLVIAILWKGVRS